MRTRYFNSGNFQPINQKFTSNFFKIFKHLPAINQKNKNPKNLTNQKIKPELGYYTNMTLNNSAAIKKNKKLD